MLREIRRRLAEDPLLKVGVVAMTFALALTGVAALIVSSGRSSAGGCGKIFRGVNPLAAGALGSRHELVELGRCLFTRDITGARDPIRRVRLRDGRRIKAAKPSPWMSMITLSQPIGNSGLPTNQDATTSLPGPS